MGEVRVRSEAWGEAATAAVPTALSVLQSTGVDKRHGGTQVGARACSLRGEMVPWGKFGPVVAGALFNGDVACGAVGGGGPQGGAMWRGGGGGSRPDRKAAGGRQRVSDAE
jgi:hypothetical protein